VDFSITEDQEALRELAKKILGDLATHERLCEVEASDEGIDRALWGELARAGLLGACLPEAHGGMGLGIYELVILLEELGAHVAPVPYWATVACGALAIARFGSGAQKQRWLPGVVQGDVFLSVAFEEPNNADPGAPTTRAEANGAGGFRLSGTKICVPAAHVAARILVPARTGDGQVGLFLLDPQSDGVELERQRATNKEPVFTLRLEGAQVSADDVVGSPDSGATLGSVRDIATLGLCALALGVSERSLRMTAEYTRERKQFDRPIGSFQAVHQRAADAYVQVECMRLTMLQAAHRLAQGEPAPTEISVAKVWAADGGNFATYAAQHLHGGIGMDNDYPLHRSYMWMRHLELMLGSTEPHLARIGSYLAEVPAPIEE
jgi:alkylation response protein AidB-like acyl-CoA dehydrogenase